MKLKKKNVFFTAKKTVKAAEWENVSIPTNQRGLISGIYDELKKQNTRIPGKQTTQLKIGLRN